MSDVVYIDGEFVPREQARVSVFDHGFLYGDGLFEGVRVYNGKVFRLDPHLKRLYDGARALGFDMSHLPYARAKEIVLETCRRNNHREGYIRVNLTRGTGLGLDPSHIDQTPSYVVATKAFGLYPKEAYENGLTMVTCATRVPSPDAINPRIKCTGKYINNITAKMEANRVGAGEGIMLNHLGYVAEATGDNIFIVRDGVIYTPPPSAGCLKGITRQVAMECAEQLGIPVREENLTLFDLYSAEECFLTGTAAEVIPGCVLDERPIGTGKPGAITWKIIEAFRKRTGCEGDPV
jgi:branched-chain amino acid aminotransferase